MAKLLQENPVVSYYFDGSDAGATDPNSVWNNDANAFDSSISTIADSLTDGSTSSNFLKAEGTNAPGSGGTILSVKARVRSSNSDDAAGTPVTNAAIYTDGLAELLGTATHTSTVVLSYGEYTTLSIPSGGWTWAKIQALETKIYRTGGASDVVNVAIVEILVETQSVDALLQENNDLILLDENISVDLNTPSDGSSGSDTTPTLEFTGTDTQSNDIRYNIQVGEKTTWYNSAWAYRIKLTIDAAKVDADLTDFPVYVDLSLLPERFHAHVNQTDARDIRVTKGDGTTEIPREVALYLHGTNKGALFFKYSGTLSGTSNTDIYIYYGNPSASDYAVTATYGARNVWDSNYIGVYHFEEISGNPTDSTANANHSDSMVRVDRPPSLLDQSLSTVAGAKGVDSYVRIPDAVSLDSSSITVELLHFLDAAATSQNKRFVARHLSFDDNNTPWIFGTTNEATPQYSLFISTGTLTNFDTNVNVPIRSLTYAALRYDATPHEVSLWLNGSEAYSNTTPSGNLVSSSHNILIGNQQDNSTPAIGDGLSPTGLLDEVRISAIARADTWMSTTNNNLTSNSTFFAIGAEQQFNPTIDKLSGFDPGFPAITATFSDNFNDNSLSGSWTDLGGANTNEVNQQLEITTALLSATYYSITTAANYDLTDRAAVIEVVSVGNQAIASLQVGFVMEKNDGTGDDQAMIYVEDNIIVFRRRAATVNSDTSIAYNSTTHRWWRIRESANNIYYDTSPDGATWTNRRVVTNPFTNKASLKATMFTGTFAVEASTTTSIYDNFSLGKIDYASGVLRDYTVQAADALATGTYYWRVRGIDPAGNNSYSEWSEVRSFTISSGATYTQDNSVKANILSVTTKNNSVKADILAIGQQPNYAKANIRVNGNTQNNHVKANIIVITTQNNHAKANILTTYTQNNHVKADILRTYLQDNSVKANIPGEKPNSVKANIKVTTTKDSSVKGNILAAGQQPSSVKANIKAVQTQNNSAKANILVAGTTSDTHVKANILVVTSQNNYAKANILAITTKDNSVKANIINAGQQPSHVKANILRAGETSGSSAKAYIIKEFGNRVYVNTASLEYLNSAVNKYSFRFTAPENKTLTKLHIRLQNSVSPPTYRFGIQSDNAGKPSGTWLGATSSGYIDTNSWTGGAWNSKTLTESVNLIAGTVYHIVIEYVSGTIGGSNYISFYSANYDQEETPYDYFDGKRWFRDNLRDTSFAFNYQNSFSVGTWTTITGTHGPYILEFSDGSARGTAAFTGYDIIDSTFFVRQSFTPPVGGLGFRVRELWIRFVEAGFEGTDPQDDLLYEIRDASNNLITSGTFLSKTGAGNLGRAWRFVTTDVEFTPGSTYYLVFKSPGTESDYGWGIDGAAIDFSPVASFYEEQTWNGTTDAVWNSANSGSSWVKDKNRDMAITVRYTDGPGGANNSVKANILVSTTQNNHTKANIKVTTSQDSAVKANILVTTTADNSAKGNIEAQVAAAFNNYVKADILVITTKDNNSIANIQATGQQPNSVKANILRSYTQDNSVKANILAGYTQDNNVKANILVITSRDSSVKANILTTYTSDNSVKANILRVGDTVSNHVKANILNIYSQDSNSKANILASVAKDSSVKANIVNAGQQPSYVKANILRIGETKDSGVKANILTYYTHDNSVKASIVVTRAQDNNAKANIVAPVTQDNHVKGNILASITHNNHVKADILVIDNVANNSVKASLVSIVSKDSASKANILQAGQQPNSVKANIPGTDILADNFVKANILTVTAVGNSVKAEIRGAPGQYVKGNLFIFLPQNNYVKANILSIITKDNAVKGNIVAEGQVPNYAKANILAIGSQNNHVKANILASQAQDNHVKANILVITSQDNNAKANILNTYTTDNSVKANIKAVTTVDNNVKANIIRFDETVSNYVKANILRGYTSDNSVKANIPGEKPNSVKANILVETTKDSAVKGNILAAGQVPNYVKANILVAGNLKDNSVKASIVVLETRNNSVKANILNIYSQDSNVKANILRSYLQDSSVKANIRAITTVDNHSKANILVVTTADNSVKASIVVTEIRDQSVKANILATILRNNFVTGNIYGPGQSANSVKANILQSYSQDSAVKANILATYTADNSVKASIFTIVSSDNSVKANIRNTYGQDNTAKANILQAYSQDNSVKANIPGEKPNTVKANILVTAQKDNAVKANIQNGDQQPNYVKANILVAGTTQSNSVKANILNTYTQNNEVKANILRSGNTSDNSTKANIKAVGQANNYVKANILVRGNTVDNAAKANIVVGNTFDNSAKGNILATSSKNNYVKANVTAPGQAANYAKANILVTGTSVSNHVKANIITIDTTGNNHAKANILVSNTPNNLTKANILSVSTANNFAKASIVVTRTYDSAAKANIMGIKANYAKGNIIYNIYQDNYVKASIFSQVLYDNSVKANIRRPRVYKPKKPPYKEAASPYGRKVYPYSGKISPFRKKKNPYSDRV